jgi:hypothetical protein
MKVVIQKRGGVWVCEQGNASATATVGTIRTTQWFEFFALYGHASFATISSAQMKGHLVNE